MKIDAPLVLEATLVAKNGRNRDLAGRGRWVAESDWRKIMAVVRAVDDADTCFPYKQDEPRNAIAALRKHLEKHK